MKEGFHGLAFLVYWIILCVLMIWFPLVVMITSFGFIYYKLSKSLKAFPYLSIQSKVARSRKKVIHMLLILIIIEIICWSPWQSWIIYQYIYYQDFDVPIEELPPVILHFTCLDVFTKSLLFSSSNIGIQTLSQFCRF